MKKMNSKFISASLAIAMVCSNLAVPTFAAEIAEPVSTIDTETAVIETEDPVKDTTEEEDLAATIEATESEATMDEEVLGDAKTEDATSDVVIESATGADEESKETASITTEAEPEVVTATYDCETRTLKLDGFDSDNRLYISDDMTIDPENNENALIYSSHDIVIELVGENTISGENIGILSEGDIEFKGTGSLTIKDAGIQIISGDLTVNGPDIQVEKDIKADSITVDKGSLKGKNYPKETEVVTEETTEDAKTEESVKEEAELPSETDATTADTQDEVVEENVTEEATMEATMNEEVLGDVETEDITEETLEDMVAPEDDILMTQMASLTEDDAVLNDCKISEEDFSARLDKYSVTLLAGDKVWLTCLASSYDDIRWKTDNEDLALTPMGESCLVTLAEDYPGDVTTAHVTVTLTANNSEIESSASCRVTIKPNEVEGTPMANGIWYVADIDNEFIAEDIKYDGKPKTPAVKVYNYNKKLVQGTDYTVTYKNNVAAADKDSKKAPSMTITLKGMYSGSITANFTIYPADISEAMCPDYSTLYNKKPQLIPPTVTYNGKALKYKTDFVVEDFQNIAPEDKKTAFVGAADENSAHYLTIKGVGNYTGELGCIYTIAGTVNNIPQVLMKSASVSAIPAQPYKMEPYTIDDIASLIKVKYKNKTLMYERDYEISVYNSEEVGTATVVLTGLENPESEFGYSFYGTKTVTFKIKGFDIAKAVVKEIGNTTHEFNGNPVTPKFSVEYLRFELLDGIDYEITKLDGVADDYYTTVGTKTLLVKGHDSFYGTKKITFKITSTSLVNAEVTNKEGGSDLTAIYSAKGAKPDFVVKNNGTTLKEGVDYTVKYTNNTAVVSKKAPTITITGKGCYKGSVSRTFEILPADIHTANIVASDVPESTKGNYKAKLTVTSDEGKVLKAGKDYTITSYRDANRNLVNLSDLKGQQDKIYVTITGIGNYEGSLTTSYKTYTKANTSVSKLVVVINPETFAGNNVEPKIAYSTEDIGIHIYASAADKKANKTLEDPANCVRIIGYSSNTKPGTGKVVLQGVGKYYGTRTCTFKINKQSFNQR